MNYLLFAVCQLLSFWIWQSPFVSLADLTDGRARKCTHLRQFKLIVADCHAIGFTEIPTNLATDVEVLVMSFNRIRKLPVNSFEPYTNIKHLYLDDNLISDIAEGVLKPLYQLQTLSMMLNGMHKIPADIINLRKLTKLYADDNKFNESIMRAYFEGLKQNFTIEFLSMGSCDLMEIPPLMRFPDLKVLNMSDNKLTSVDARQLAHACKLEELDLNHNDELFINDLNCSCQALSQYLSERNIKLVPPYRLNCTQTNMLSHNQDCQNITSEEINQIFNSCMNHHSTVKLAAQNHVLLVLLYIFLGLVGLIVIGIIVRLCQRRNRRKCDQIRNNNNNSNMIQLNSRRNSEVSISRDAEELLNCRRSSTPIVYDGTRIS